MAIITSTKSQAVQGNYFRSAWLGVVLVLSSNTAAAERASLPQVIGAFLEEKCAQCHTGSQAEAGLDLSNISFDLSQRETRERWTLIHDRIRDGEMPPPDDEVPRPVAAIGWSSLAGSAAESESDKWTDAERTLRELAKSLIDADKMQVAESGRSKVRRLNRLEYENTLQIVLQAPWLQVAHLLPEDGVHHLYPKSGERLDVSHVQVSRFLEVAEISLRRAVNAAAHPTSSRKFYARDEPTINRYLFYRPLQSQATRSIVPLIGTTPETDVIRQLKPVTVGNADPELRELEAMGVFSSAYSATTKYDFTRIEAPTDGRYRLRFKTYTFMAGPNGASGGDDNGLTGGRRNWWRPDRNVAFPGKRSEPVSLYALTDAQDSRLLTAFDSHPEPSVFECEVVLRQGEGIRPDATRLVRTRPGYSGNPLATAEGVPGFAMNWLEVVGPLHESWPPASYQAVFDDLPFEVDGSGTVRAVSDTPRQDAQRLLSRLQTRIVSDRQSGESVFSLGLVAYDQASELGYDFTDAVIAASAAMLCSPQFLYLDELPGSLSQQQWMRRLSYFLWNGPTSDELEAETNNHAIVERMLDDPRREQFTHNFLNYWLNLRDLNANSPDAVLYPDYYLDDALTESSLLETQAFFGELIDRDLPVRNLVDSDFTYVNERLGKHYQLPAEEGVALKRIQLPNDSTRGGLLTQASILRVTANGTTTSPVVRGAWVMQRIVGMEIPPPPSGVSAVEPDIRGATTIREQLEKHRAHQSCNSCHAKFDPPGLALESFDVAGGWRTRYRATGDIGEPVEGFGKNGHAFAFKLAQIVDCSGELLSGDAFADIRELKQLLVSNERQLARNLLHQLIVYSTGTPVMFADRAEVEEMLDRAAKNNFGVRTLIHEVVGSKLFCEK